MIIIIIIIKASAWSCFCGKTYKCVCLLQSDLTQDITTSVLWVNSKPHMITLDYTIQVPKATQQNLPEVR